MYPDHLQNLFDFGQDGVPQPWLLNTHIYLFISVLWYLKKWKKKFSIWELSSYQAGCIPDCCVVRLFKYINWFCSISIQILIFTVYNFMKWNLILKTNSLGDFFHMKVCFYQQRKAIVSIGWFYNHLISRMGFPILLRTHLYFESRARCLRLTAMCSTKMTLLIRLWMSQAITASQQTGLSSYSTTSIWQYGRVDVHEV